MHYRSSHNQCQYKKIVRNILDEVQLRVQDIICFCVTTATLYLIVERLTYQEEHKYEQETNKTAILQTSTPEIFVIFFTGCLVTYSSTPATYKSGCIGWNNKLQATTPASCFKILSYRCYVMLLHRNIEDDQLLKQLQIRYLVLCH